VSPLGPDLAPPRHCSSLARIACSAHVFAGCTARAPAQAVGGCCAHRACGITAHEVETVLAHARNAMCVLRTAHSSRTTRYSSTSANMTQEKAPAMSPRLQRLNHQLCCGCMGPGMAPMSTKPACTKGLTASRAAWGTESLFSLMYTFEMPSHLEDAVRQWLHFPPVSSHAMPGGILAGPCTCGTLATPQYPRAFRFASMYRLPAC
jgi:hypothetical protein